MYINNNALSNSDLVFLYDDDFYNSSIIYKLPTTSYNEFSTDYLDREDIISSTNYGQSELGLGLTLISLYELLKDEVQTKDKNSTYSISNGIKPFETYLLLDASEVTGSQSDILQENELSDVDINDIRRPEVKEYVYDKDSNSFITPEEAAARLAAQQTA